MWSKITRTKRIHPETKSNNAELSRKDLVMFGIGGTIGAGIFALCGVGAQYAGPSVCISFLISGTLAMFTALMYSELSSRIPVSGSAYTYTYVTFGELPAWVVAWNMNLRYGFGSAGLSRGVAEYLDGLIFRVVGTHLPLLLTDYTFFGFEHCSILAVLFLMIFTEVFVRGMQASNIFNQALTIMKLATLFVIVLFALMNFKLENLHPFVLEEKGGWLATVNAAALVYYSYLGFDMITTLSDEAKNPVRDVPLAVADNTLLCALVYFLVSFSIVGMARIEHSNPDTALPEAFNSVGMLWMTKIIYFCGFVGISAACFSNHIAQPRILVPVADDGLLPPIFCKLDPDTRIPVAGAWLVTIPIGLIAFMLDLE